MSRLRCVCVIAHANGGSRVCVFILGPSPGPLSARWSPHAGHGSGLRWHPAVEGVLRTDKRYGPLARTQKATQISAERYDCAVRARVAWGAATAEGRRARGTLGPTLGQIYAVRAWAATLVSPDGTYRMLYHTRYSAVPLKAISCMVGACTSASTRPPPDRPQQDTGSADP